MRFQAWQLRQAKLEKFYADQLRLLERVAS
jgi:hypothetical protein